MGQGQAEGRQGGTGMSPNEINTKHGSPVWTCVTCRAETGLHWWNGLSVAVCGTAACAERFSAMCKAQADEQEAYEDHCREHGW